MRVKIKHANGQVSTVEDADLMIVEDNKGDPVSVAVEYGPVGAFLVACATVDDNVRFNELLRNLGIDRTVIAVPLDLKKPSDLPYLAGGPPGR